MLRFCCILLAAILLPVAGLAQSTANSANDDDDFLRRADAARTYGADTLRATVHEFADPACGTCREFHIARKDSLNALLRDRANFVYRFTPIPRLMRGYHGAKAALCAGGIAGKEGFETMLDNLFDEQTEWRVLRDPYPAFEGYARAAGFPLDAFRDCYVRDAVAPLIVTDLRYGGRYGATGTPTFAFVPPGQGLTAVDLFYGNEPMRRFEEALSRLPSNGE